ncbi:conserved Plasmodium protein, unknown function [Plasmodium ovale]|uniref:Uncharacterized protein n=1 Tax=Plasmodium ovale TaxID=36330 RepID=A0A1D3TKV0_PLAOA|nr:conserved Plasmodium protein, unknown function [Plasmodium ovale]
MESKITFFREYEFVERKIKKINKFLNSKEENKIIEYYSQILDDFNYLNNCLNSYREANTVLDRHITSLIYSFLKFLKKSFNKLINILSYFNFILDKKKKENDRLYNMVENEIEIQKKNCHICQKKENDIHVVNFAKDKCNEIQTGDIHRNDKYKLNIEKKCSKDEKVTDNMEAYNEETNYESEILKIFIIIEEVYKYYNTLISVRGEKKIKTFFPCDAFCLNSIVDILLTIKKEENTFIYLTKLKFNKTDEDNSWVILYVLLIWLSFCMYIPFDLTNVNKNIQNNIQEIFYYYIKKNDKSKDACSILYSQFLNREDVYKNKIYFNNFIIFSKEIMKKMVQTSVGNRTEFGEHEQTINSANLPSCCNVQFTNLLLHGILLTHKKILKKLDKKFLRCYTNFYTFFLIHNHANLDSTEMAKSLKIRCLGYYALLFLERNEVTKRVDNAVVYEGVSKGVIQKRPFEEEGQQQQLEQLEQLQQQQQLHQQQQKQQLQQQQQHHELFDGFPHFLSINDVFILYQKSKGIKLSNTAEEDEMDVHEEKKYTCEKDIITILEILFCYFNDSNSNVRWSLSKCFGNILIYLSTENMYNIINKFVELRKYNDYTILCTINFTFFHFLFNKKSISVDMLNYLLKKVTQSLYMNKEKINTSAFVLLYSMFKYNRIVKRLYEENDTRIYYFFFHLIFIKLIVFSLLEDNVNIRKSAMSLLQIFIGKFNFLYQLRVGTAIEGGTHIPVPLGDSSIERRTCLTHRSSDVEISRELGNQNKFFNNILLFTNLFFDHANISDYYERVKSGVDELETEEYTLHTCLHVHEARKESYDRNKVQMEELKSKFFNENIELLSTCNFSDMINFKKSIILKTKEVCNFFLYKYPIIYHLYVNKLFHENVNIRILTSESLANLAHMDNDNYFVEVILPFLIKKSYEENILVKHGSIVCISKILLKLKRNIDENLQKEIKNILIFSEKKRIYKYKKGEILRHSLCLLVQSICQCNYFTVKKNTHSFFLDIIHNNLFHYNEIIQFEASKIFYYIPIYVLTKEITIEYVYEVLIKIIKAKDNFLHLKGYLILLCFINESIIPYVSSHLISLLVHMLKKSSTYYKIKNGLLKRTKKADYNTLSHLNLEKDNFTVNNTIKKDLQFFQKINFETYPIDVNMKIFSLLALFNLVDKLRGTYMSEFLSLYSGCTTSFRGLIREKLPHQENSQRRDTISGGSSHGSSGGGIDRGSDRGEPRNSCFRVRKRRNTSFYMKRGITFVKKKINWERVVEKGNKESKHLMQFNLDINKMAKILILYLQEYVYETDVGDSHIFVREICLGLTAFLLTSYPLFFFKRKTKGCACKGDDKQTTEEIEVINKTEGEPTKKEFTFMEVTVDMGAKTTSPRAKKTNESLSKNYFYDCFHSDDSHEDDNSSGESVASVSSSSGGGGEEKDIINVYVLFEIKKKYVNVFIQLLLKLLCEKNMRTHKKCLFLLNYLYNYGTFNDRGEMENFSFSNIFNKYCHDFPYELFLKKKIDDNVRKSKLNIFQYLKSYETDISSIFKNMVMHVCDYYQPLYLKDKEEVARNAERFQLTNCDMVSIGKKGGEITKIGELGRGRYTVVCGDNVNAAGGEGEWAGCSCSYEEEITALFLNKNYKYGLVKTIFNKINNFIYLYNYALRYTSFSIFHKNKFSSTRKGLIKGQHIKRDISGDRGEDISGDRGEDSSGDRGEDSSGDRGADSSEDRRRDSSGDRGADNSEDRRRDSSEDCRRDSSGNRGRVTNVGGGTLSGGEKERTRKDDNLKFEDIYIDNDFVDEINLSESEDKMSLEDENIINDIHYLMDKTKKNISVIKYLEYNEHYLFSHVFYLLFLNKYNYYIISGFFNTLCYYSSHTEYSNYEYTNLIKKGKEKSIEFLFLEFLLTHQNVYTFGYIRDDILFLYIRYYVKYYLNYDYAIVEHILRDYNIGKAGQLFAQGRDHANSGENAPNIGRDDAMSNHFNGETPYRKNESSVLVDGKFSLHTYNMHDVNLSEIILFEKNCNGFNFSKNIFHNYDVFFDTNVILLDENKHGKQFNREEIKKEKKNRLKINKKIRKQLHIKIELLQYVNICLIKILYYLNNFNLIQLETFLRSVNSFTKFSILSNFTAFCFLSFFLHKMEKYTTFTLVKTIAELIINIFMCPTLHINIKKLAIFLILNLLLHRYPKIREFTNEYFYTNINFISPDDCQNYLFNSFEDLETVISILISTQFSEELKNNGGHCQIREAVRQIANILSVSLYATF